MLSAVVGVFKVLSENSALLLVLYPCLHVSRLFDHIVCISDVGPSVLLFSFDLVLISVIRFNTKTFFLLRLFLSLRLSLFSKDLDCLHESLPCRCLQQVVGRFLVGVRSERAAFLVDYRAHV